MRGWVVGIESRRSNGRRGSAGPLGSEGSPHDRTATVGPAVTLLVQVGAVWTALSLVASLAVGRALRELDRAPASR